MNSRKIMLMIKLVFSANLKTHQLLEYPKLLAPGYSMSYRGALPLPTHLLRCNYELILFNLTGTFGESPDSSSPWRTAHPKQPLCS